MDLYVGKACGKDAGLIPYCKSRKREIICWSAGSNKTSIFQQPEADPMLDSLTDEVIGRLHMYIDLRQTVHLIGWTFLDISDWAT